MLNLILVFPLIITVIQNITGVIGSIPVEGDCSSYVTSGNVTYKGCKLDVSTESLGNPPSIRKGVFAFKGMPYAKDPSGDLRFAKPVKIDYAINTSIDATNFGSSCMQPPIIADSTPISEDCLFVNVYTPTMNSSANLPVMFWIHGGAFIVYSGNSYNGSQLALRDCVVVTINYRLGVFGFFFGNRSDAPGNVGLWDQALALNWTIDNIAAFGGDPKQITVFGESAGSIAVSYFAISNQTRNLFQRVIMQSGTGYQKILNRDPDFAYKAAVRLSSNPLLICIDESDLIKCLRKANATVLLLAQLTAIAFNPSTPLYSTLLLQFVPMFGDFYNFMPISIPEAVRTGNFRRDINYFIGHNEMEGLTFTQPLGLIQGLSARYVPKVCPILEFLNPLLASLNPPLYPPLMAKATASNDINYIFLNWTLGPTPGQKHTETFEEIDLLFNVTSINRLRGSAVHALGDFLITCPTVLYGYYIAKFQALTKKVFQYRLTYADTSSAAYGSCWANVTHGDEVRLVFGRPFFVDGFNADDKNISAQMMDTWTTFAKTDGLPKVNGLDWPPYYASSNITNLSYVELHPSPTRFGRIFTERYDGVDDGFTPNCINNCLNFWDSLLYGQF